MKLFLHSKSSNSPSLLLKKMNAKFEHVKNFLFLGKGEFYSEDFHKLCLECTKHELTALLITRKPMNLLRLLSKEDVINKEQLMKCIIMHFECIDDIVKKLLELHNWTLLPVLIVIDLHSFVVNELAACQPRGEAMELLENSSNSTTCLQSICHCIATLFNYMNSVEKRLFNMKKSQAIPGNVLAHSIVLLGEHTEAISKAQLELLINLYYYEGTAFDCYDEIKRLVTATWRTEEIN